METTRRGFLARVAGIVTVMVVGSKMVEAEPLYNTYTFPPSIGRWETKVWSHAMNYGMSPKTFHEGVLPGLTEESILKATRSQQRRARARAGPSLDQLAERAIWGRPEPRLWTVMRGRKA